MRFLKVTKNRENCFKCAKWHRGVFELDTCLRIPPHPTLPTVPLHPPYGSTLPTVHYDTSPAVSISPHFKIVGAKL